MYLNLNPLVQKHCQVSASEGTGKKQKRRKKTDKDVTETKKRVKNSADFLTGKPSSQSVLKIVNICIGNLLLWNMFLLFADDKDAEKPKRRRKRKQDGENQAIPSKAKKRRSSPCPDPEVTRNDLRSLV